MDAIPELVLTELYNDFGDLKKFSLSHNVCAKIQNSGDKPENELEKQFTLIFGKIEETLGKLSKASPDYFKMICMKCFLIYEKGKMYMTENLLKESQDMFELGLQVVSQYVENTNICFLYLRIVNHLSYVLSKIGEIERAMELLEKVVKDDKVYNPDVFTVDDLFTTTSRDATLTASKMEKLNINNMQLLSWIYGKLGNTEQHLKLQHDILQKQLDCTDTDAIQWAQSCYRLAGMFVTSLKWTNATYHLSAAESILSPLEMSMIPNPTLYRTLADLARSWVFYGLQLFDCSRKFELKDLFGQDAEDMDPRLKDDGNDDEVFTFDNLVVEIPPTLPSKKIKNIQDAKALFLAMQTYIKRARLYYTLRDFPLQYVNLSLDLSELYRYLAFYEEDIDAQYAVQKKRYDALEALSAILKEVRPHCYVAINVELMKEIIEVQMELMNINLRKLYTPAENLSVCPKPDLTRRQMTAVSQIYSKLEHVQSTMDNSQYANSGVQENVDANNNVEDDPSTFDSEDVVENIVAAESGEPVESETDVNKNSNSEENVE